MRILFIDVNKKESKIRIIENQKIKGVVDLGIYLHINEYESYKYNIFDEKNVLIIGAGKYSYGGTQRGIVIFRSPLHGGLHISTLGDIGEYIKKSGFDAIVIEGKAKKEVFLIIDNENVIFLEEEIPESIFKKSEELKDKLKDIYDKKNFRILLVGLASKNTKYGSLISLRNDKPEILSVAGRGGAGTVLYRAHNVIGLSIGGDKNYEIVQYDIKKVAESTKKYREDGTFRGNYPHLKGNLPYFNFQNIYLNQKDRERLYITFIENILLKDYLFTSDTCGEKCIAACKKLENEVKIDYEPANGLGPFIGIFNRNLVKDLIKIADNYGFDSIYLGYVLGLLFEAASKERIDLKIFGLEENPILDLSKYDQDYSEKNYRIAKYLIEKIANGKIEILGENIRKIAKEFKIDDLAYYIPFGENYDMTPNFYWTLGLLLPTAVPGKYYSDYKFIGKLPEEYSKICFERTLYEYTIDNYGMCRFHRVWIETDILKSEDLENSKYWISRLIEYRKLANAEPQYWESKRVIDSVKKLLEEFNISISPEEYWKTWYNKYLDLVFS
ncbi:MAG: aldehyde ferredoxin oxidoreductase N-terminal domain-containing protein [Candidatus Aenigmatarchaeota archaeon]